MAPRVSPARSNSWTAWRSSMLSILRGPPVVGTGPYLEAGTYLRMPGGRTEFREKSGQNLENQQGRGLPSVSAEVVHGAEAPAAPRRDGGCGRERPADGSAALPAGRRRHALRGPRRAAEAAGTGPNRFRNRFHEMS